MRDAFWILGVLLAFAIGVAPWSSMYDFFWKERNKKYKSREDVILTLNAGEGARATSKFLTPTSRGSE